MILWLVFAALALATVAALLWPLWRARSAGAERLGYDLAVYKDQLAEVDRDRERGLLNEAQAEAARTEIQRRALAAAERDRAEAAAAGAARPRRLAAVFIAIVVPAGAFAIYGTLGAPGLPDQPFRERQVQQLDMPRDQAEKMIQLVEQLAARMKERPDEPQGWMMLARSYRALGRHADAAEAYRRAVALGIADADTLSSWGESLAMAKNGEIGPEARQAFADALAADPGEPRAAYYLGLAALQAGDAQGAIAIWKNMQSGAPADAPWLPMINERIAAVAQQTGLDPAGIAAKAPQAGNGSAAAAQAPAGMDEERIRAMVDQLAARMADSPGDFDGWMRLGRSRLVLGEADKAAEAYRKAVALKPDSLEARLGLAGALLANVPKDAALPAEFVAEMREVARLEPANADALYFLGLAEMQAGRPGEARVLWTKLRDQLPESSPDRADLDRQIQALPAS